MKKILLKIFNRRNKIIKFLSIIKNIFFNFIKVGKISKRYAINFLPKLILSQIQIEKIERKFLNIKITLNVGIILIMMIGLAIISLFGKNILILYWR